MNAAEEQFVQVHEASIEMFTRLGLVDEVWEQQMRTALHYFSHPEERQGPDYEAWRAGSLAYITGLSS